MSEDQRAIGWLARRHERKRLRRERTGDSAEKRAQRYTTRGRELAAKDEAMRTKGGGTAGGPG